VNICIKCVKDSHLKALIDLEGIQGTCSLCDEKDISLDSESNCFFQLVKALVRYNYSEWEYNTHWGGIGYESIFHGPSNIFFVRDRATSDDAYENLVLSITEGSVYEDYDKGVSIYAGYGESGAQNMLLRAIKSDLDKNLLLISTRLKNENYFLLENEVTAVLNKFITVAEKRLSKVVPLYRARIGCEDKKRAFGNGFETATHYIPYSSEQIAAPPPYRACAGRINRLGISFLYCATDKYTAISEVRPHPGDLVSIGMFKLKQDIKLFDLSDSQLLHFYKTDEQLDTYRPFNTLGVLINKAIPPSERQHYSITQLIADCIRQLGFDGIKFSSSVGDGDGHNIVLFDQFVAKYTGDKADVVEVDRIEYSYHAVPMVSDNEGYL